MASFSENVEVVRLLTAHKDVDINRPDNAGASPFMVAENKEIKTIFRARGAR